MPTAPGGGTTGVLLHHISNLAAALPGLNVTSGREKNVIGGGSSSGEEVGITR